jgi:hypothetical protein
MDFELLVDKIIDIIDENEDLIFEEYNGKEDQILLDKKLVEKIKKEIQKHITDEKLLVNMLKLAIREAFELEERDIVVEKKGYIFIKLVSELQQQIPQGRKSSQEARYNGFDEKELIAFYNEFCNDEGVKKLIDQVSHEFVQQYIIEEKLSNEIYEKKVFAIIKQLFFKHLQEIYENDDEFMMGFAGYIFRINFEQVFLDIASYLLEYLASGDKTVKEFLEYYSHEVIIVGGEKYAVPQITSYRGHKWKVVSILSIVRVYFSALQSIREIKIKMQQFEKIVKQYEIQGRSPLQQQQLIKEKLQELTTQINENIHKIEQLYDTILDGKITNEKKQELKRKVNFLKNETDKLQGEKKRYEELIVPQNVILKYQQNQRELDALKRELNNKTRLLEQNQKAYDEIRHSLMKALIQKKKKLPS